jgi:Xaa-Pro aminopeptidase
MKSDLDLLMQERGYAALLVTGGSAGNPPMFYLTQGAKVGEATIVIKKRGEAPVVFANSMEREEAARSGLRVVDLNQYRFADLLKEEKGDRLRATARLYSLILTDLGVRGPVAALGRRDQGTALALLTAINDLDSGVRIVGEFDKTIFDLATTLKDADEVKRIRAVGRKTVNVVAGTEAFLVSHRARNGYLVKKDGTRLTIGDVKGRINQLLMQEGVVDAEDGTIFAIGRDAGIPHSRGADRHPLALGQTIVYDIFPAEPGGGYFYDFTRTWCLGYAPPAVEQAYQDVLDTFDAVMAALQPGALCSDYQRLACDMLEARGHPTIRKNPETTSGYVHSLGHGVGLRIHEFPRLSDAQGNADRLDPGVVFTVEPGVYYPERKFGVRLEDTVWLNPATQKFEVLAKYPKSLVLPVKGAAAHGRAAQSAAAKPRRGG